MLYRRDDAIALDPANRCAHHDAGHERIFARVLKIASVARITGYVSAPGKQNVETFCPRLGAHPDSREFGKLGVESGSGCKPSSTRPRFVTRSHFLRLSHP